MGDIVSGLCNHKEAIGLKQGQEDAMEEQGGQIQSHHEVLPQRQRRKKKTREAWKNGHEQSDEKIEGGGKRNRLMNGKEEAEFDQHADTAVRKYEGGQVFEIKDVDARQKIEDSDAPPSKDINVEKEGDYHFECTACTILSIISLHFVIVAAVSFMQIWITRLMCNYTRGEVT